MRRGPNHGGAWAIFMTIAICGVFAVDHLAGRQIVDPPVETPEVRGPKLAPRVLVRTSPRGGATELVVWHIGEAKSSIFIGSYQWSSKPIHAAVVKAKTDGVKVRILLDNSMETSSTSLVKQLLSEGFTDGELRVDDRHAIFHHKLVIRDGDEPAWAAHENGSFNFSAAAENSNAENAQVTEGFPEATRTLLDNMEIHWAHSRPPKVK